MVGNLVVVLLLDHVSNRGWWRLLARNSLARQLMYNSTSILCEMKHAGIVDSKYSSTLTIQVSTLCTLQWFLTSHLVRFGLPEEPSLLRRLSSIASVKKGARHSTGATSDKGSMPAQRTPQTNATTGIPSTTAIVDATNTDHDHVPPDNEELFLVAQDHEGNVLAYDSCKREVLAAAMDGKVALGVALRIQ
ncbi:hypothetical protein H310_03191 [Aphanomyces invadans]|uniref:Uncharacterized protein n=1 Tax=Aphanomyces invadans TaxID=157072 RepID=A0A024UGB4_9STRA|nr:hypothetical protein H310_03191 [Aphanomyces invadans]ETW05426.1 hypothetical protein H310_03191 [Aphanomyces invadans]|eukprot:XP_008865203.1 hypothetical protein H310_03191 [Aphanomyces invadans]